MRGDYTAVPNDPESDHKDLIEHLRTVHFTLVVVCVALAVIISGPAANEIRTAHQQLRDIIGLSQHWDLEWFDKEANARASQIIPQSNNAPTLRPFPKAIEYEGTNFHITFTKMWTIIDESFPPLNMSHMFKVDFNPNSTPPSWLDSLPSKKPSLSNCLLFEKSTISPPGTLQEFRAIWDFAGNAKLYVVTGLTGSMGVSDGESDFGKFSPYKESEQQLGLAMPLDLCALSEKETSELQSKDRNVWALHVYKGLYYTESSHRANPVIFPVQETAIDFNLQGLLVRESHSQWLRGPFARTFKELDSVTSGFQDLTFQRLEAFVAKQEDQSKESFEQFGIKFPVEYTAAWGIPVILVLQIYFWLHLRELRERKVNGVDSGVAWVGVYDYLGAKILVISSALVLPVGIIVGLGFMGLWSKYYGTARVLVRVAVIIAIAASCFFASNNQFLRADPVKWISSLLHRFRLRP